MWEPLRVGCSRGRLEKPPRSTSVQRRPAPRVSERRGYAGYLLSGETPPQNRSQAAIGVGMMDAPLWTFGKLKGTAECVGRYVVDREDRGACVRVRVCVYRGGVVLMPL